MKILGCALAIIGALLCAVSATLFGVAISRAMDAREVVVLPVAIGEKAVTQPLQVEPSKFIMVGFRANVKSNHAKLETGKTDEYDLQYAFPFRYRVLDSSGKSVIAEDTLFAFDKGSRTYTNEYVTEDGGSAHIQSTYEKVQPPTSGQIRVEAEIGPDTTYQAELDQLELVVFDNVSRHMKSVTTGVAVLFVGGILTMAGLVLFIVAMVRKPGPHSPPPYPPAA